MSKFEGVAEALIKIISCNLNYDHRISVEGFSWRRFAIKLLTPKQCHCQLRPGGNWSFSSNTKQ